MRRPSLHKKFDVPNDVGLSDILIGRATLAQSVQRTDRPGVDVLTSGGHSPNPIKLLQSSRFDALLREARERYATVIVDAPALVPVFDAAIVAAKTDGTVMILVGGPDRRPLDATRDRAPRSRRRERADRNRRQPFDDERRRLRRLLRLGRSGAPRVAAERVTGGDRKGARMPAPQPQRTYFPHVEGLRGVAALYVFLYHLWQSAVAHAGATLTALLPFTLPWLQFGHFAVSVFIVISGYCLGLPVATRPDRRFDPRTFARRRARRLGPAYVLALFLSVIPFYVTLALRGQHVPFSHVAGAIVSHLLLVHNLVPALSEYLNGPMWSIALEVQIYVVFALLLVPVWKRFGPWAQLAVALVIGLAPQLLLHGALDYTAPWMLALFGIGVVAAQVTARGSAPAWVRFAAVACAIAAVAMVLPRGDAAADGDLWPADLVVGAAVALLFVSASGAALPLTARFLALRPIVLLGTFSYSLYLIHAPLVIATAAAVGHWHAGTLASGLAYGLLIPVTIALAYGFYRVAERPFLSPEFRAAIEAAPTAEQPLRDSSSPAGIVAAYKGA